MRKSLATRLQHSFPTIKKAEAQTAVELLKPRDHRVVAKTRVSTTAPPAGRSLLKWEDRDGEELLEGTCVSVAEEQHGLVRVVQPAKGWVPKQELVPVGAPPGADDRALELVSMLLRSAKNYNLSALQELGDEIGWSFDFMFLARKRIIEAVQKKSDEYETPTLNRATRVKGEDDLRACLLALDRKDISFIMETLALPKPTQPPKPKAKPVARQAPPKSRKSQEMVELEHENKELRNALEEKTNELEAMKAKALASEVPEEAEMTPPTKTAIKSWCG